MTNEQTFRIRNMRRQGLTYAKIADLLGLSINSVKSFCLRKQIDCKGKNGDCCKNCGEVLIRIPKRKPRLFCSNECRYAWWNVNRKNLKGGNM